MKTNRRIQHEKGIVKWLQIFSFFKVNKVHSTTAITEQQKKQMHGQSGFRTLSNIFDGGFSTKIGVNLTRSSYFKKNQSYINITLLNC